MAPTNKGGEKDHSAINEVMIRKYTMAIHQCIHEVGFKEHAILALREPETCYRNGNFRHAQLPGLTKVSRPKE